MKHLGDYDTGGVIYGKFTTFDPTTGQPATLGTGASLAVYKNADTTESVAGVTLIVDFDGKIGLHHFTIDTSADGSFYAAGSFFDIVLASGSVGGISVANSEVASFTLRRDSSLKVGANADAVSFTGGVTISNAAGSALTLSSSGGNGNGLAASGNGSGDGISASGGATGRGIHAAGGGTSGAGILAEATGDNSNGITANGFGSGHGIASTGGATGDGMHALGGATSGSGLVAEARGGNSNGLQGIGFGSGLDLAADNIATNAQATAIQAKTDNLPSDPADQSLVIAATTAIYDRIGAPAGASVSADIAAVKADTGAGATAAALTTVGNNVTAVKAKTDSLAFSVAGQVDANVQYVNDTQVTGDGQPGTEWGPA